MEDLFETSDLYLAAFLLASGHTLSGVDGHDPQRVVFLLTPCPGAGLLAAYAGGKASVNVLRYLSAERQLKRRLWAARGPREVRT